MAESTPPRDDNPQAETPEENDLGKALWEGKTPDSLQRASKKTLSLFLPTRQVEGLENLEKIPPGRRIILLSPHSSNFDVPLIVDALGNLMNLQITGMSTHWEDAKKHMLNYAGKSSFSPISYKKSPKGYSPVFDPWNFEDIRDIVDNEDKVPWMGYSRPDLNNKNPVPPGTGFVYLASLLDAVIVPVVTEIQAPGKSFEGIGDQMSFFKSRISTALGMKPIAQHSAIVKIGKPIEIPHVDTAAIKLPFSRRLYGEKATKEQMEKYSQESQRMREIAEKVTQQIKGEFSL